MANLNCDACEQLRQTDPSLIVNGFTDSECASLKNDTGLVPGSGHDDCTDLNNMNDCMVGNMATEVSAYDVCDWKSFMKKFIPNVWTVIHAVICAVCGLWSNVHSIWENIQNLWNTLSTITSQVDKIDCIIAAMSSQKTFSIGKENITLAPGVSFRDDDSATPTISGNAYCAYITGGIHFGSSWTDDTSWLDSDGDTANGGRLVYTYKINKAANNLIRLWPCLIAEANAGSGLIAHLQIFNEGTTAWGYASRNDSSGAVTVPSGYVYAQVRLVSVAGGWGAAKSGTGKGDVTLCGVAPVLLDSSVNC